MLGCSKVVFSCSCHLPSITMKHGVSNIENAVFIQVCVHTFEVIEVSLQEKFGLWVSTGCPVNAQGFVLSRQLYWQTETVTRYYARWISLRLRQPELEGVRSFKRGYLCNLSQMMMEQGNKRCFLQFYNLECQTAVSALPWINSQLSLLRFSCHRSGLRRPASPSSDPKFKFALSLIEAHFIHYDYNGRRY